MDTWKNGKNYPSEIKVGRNTSGRGKDCAKHRHMDFHEFGYNREFDLSLDKREGKKLGRWGWNHEGPSVKSLDFIMNAVCNYWRTWNCWLIFLRLRFISLRPWVHNDLHGCCNDIRGHCINSSSQMSMSNIPINDDTIRSMCIWFTATFKRLIVG